MQSRPVACLRSLRAASAPPHRPGAARSSAQWPPLPSPRTPGLSAELYAQAARLGGPAANLRLGLWTQERLALLLRFGGLRGKQHQYGKGRQQRADHYGKLQYRVLLGMSKREQANEKTHREANAA